MNPNDSHLKTYNTRLQEISRMINSEFMPLREDQLNWKPKPKSWSIAECIKHLELAFEGYLSGLDKAIEMGNRNNISGRKKPEISWSGKIMVFFVNPSIKIWVPAPPSFKPKKHHTYTHEILHQFLSDIQRISAQLESSKSLDWNQLKIVSPVTSLLILNLNDTYEILTLHALRHIKQAQRVMSHDHFPS